MCVHEVVKHVIVIFGTEVIVVFQSLSNQNDSQMVKMSFGYVFSKTIILRLPNIKLS